jgi:catechol 2,3-dioxygenase-like lactoylglutathione lyase family enzyme
MSNRNFDHIALSVKDITESVRWYEHTLQASVLYKDETWAMLEVSGVKLALTIPTQHPPHLAFAVDDIKELGSQYREHRDGSCYVYKCDPDGNTIELIYWRNNNGN